MAKLIKKKKVAKTEKKQELMDVSHIKGLKVIPLRTRKFVEFHWDFTNKEVDIPVIKPEQVKDAIVKVSIRVKQEDAHKIDTTKIAKQITPFCYILKPIVPSVQRLKRARIERITSEIEPLEAAKLWIQDKKIKDPDKILQLAENIMREVGKET